MGNEIVQYFIVNSEINISAPKLSVQIGHVATIITHEPEYCCDGKDCGWPIHPPICGDECNEEWNRRSREDVIKILKERNKLC